MNHDAWLHGSGISASALWSTIAAVSIGLSVLVLGSVIAALFDRVIWDGMDRERAWRYGVRALAAVVLLLMLFQQ
jgi:hypothetical protein